MNGMDSFLLGKAMAENSQSLHSMFAGQRAAADRREDQATIELIRQLSDGAEKSNSLAWRHFAEKKATAALLKSVLKNGGSLSEQSWNDFYREYNAVRAQEPKYFNDLSAQECAKKVFEHITSDS